MMNELNPRSVEPPVSEDLQTSKRFDHTTTVADANEEEEDSDSSTIYWWQVPRDAPTCGDLVEFSCKGKARKNSSRTVSFDWVFSPATDAATRSPVFSWLDLSWSLRFQRSPFCTGLYRDPAWSIFLDLHPPFTKIFRVAGTIVWKLDDKTRLTLWKFDEEFAPAFDEQEVCTWDRHRLDIAEHVQQMQGRDIVLHVKLTAWGMGRDAVVDNGMRQVHEILPFTLKVGTTTLSRRFGWDIRQHLALLTDAEIGFWKSLLDNDPKGHRRLKFGPRDLVNVIRSVEIRGIATWTACRELKHFAVRAIHHAPHGVAAIPYHLVFFNFDLMDGSDNDDDPRNEAQSIEFCAPPKHSIIVELLDWIILYPLRAACAKMHGGSHDKTQPSASFASIQSTERGIEDMQSRHNTVHCGSCSKPGERGKMNTCANCRASYYCNRGCQRSHWKQGHKHECANMNEERKARLKAHKNGEKKLEEQKALDCMEQLIDDAIQEYLPNPESPNPESPLLKGWNSWLKSNGL